MPKNKKRKRTKASAAAATPQAQPITRRDWMRRVGYLGLGAAIVGAGGILFSRDVKKTMAEQDLSVIGQGTPVILQIHDQTCSLCAALQRQTRKALRSFDEDAVIYRVANIATKEGRAIQIREGLPHVTLVLYNGAGQRVHHINGVTQASDLIEQFETYLGLTRS